MKEWEKMCFHAFGQCFRLFLDRALQKNTTKNEERVNRLSLNFPKLKTEFKNSYLLLRQRAKTFCLLFGPHCIISSETQGNELKFSIHTNFGTLISNLKLYFQYNIVISSWWRYIRKVGKTTSFINSNPQIYWYILINITNITYFS